MHWAGVLLGYGNKPGEILNDQDALSRADAFFANPHALGAASVAT
jgi:hypothetical protein